jgi:DNA-binding MarR family transcriptional regulator
MSPPRQELVLDRLIHEPGRLAILTVLSSVRDADFVFLQRATGMTKGNLSSHLTKLEDAGLVAIEKRFVRKKPNTNVALTPDGKRRIAHHWDQLERLKTLSETAGGGQRLRETRNATAGKPVHDQGQPRERRWRRMTMVSHDQHPDAAERAE